MPPPPPPLQDARGGARGLGNGIGKRDVEGGDGGDEGDDGHDRHDGQGLTLVPNSAQLELFRPPYNPT